METEVRNENENVKAQRCSMCMPDCRYTPGESANCNFCIRNPELKDNYEPQLKACPFCGGSAELERDIHSHTSRVVCTVCKITQPWNGSAHIAIRKWNDREIF